jgi:phosphomannomutase / phosphoglucomutase
VSIFKACDIRGVVGEDLDGALARRIGRSLGRMILRRGSRQVCLAGDFRRSTPPLKEAVLAGLLDAGAKVYDGGQVPTPVAYFAARHLGCPNVAIVTASHNPGKYNGLKFMVSGRPAVPALVQELQEGLATDVKTSVPGSVEPIEILPAYETQVVSDAAAEAGSQQVDPADRRLRIVVDTMGGAFTEIAPRVLAAAGCEVRALSVELDPDFQHRHPNPSVDENLGDLSQMVASEHADLGVALDGDGDRAAFLDGDGRVVRPEQIGALLAGRCYKAPKVIYDQKCASVLTNAVRRAGGTCQMQPSGHGFIKTAMIEQQADLGVEVSGHYFFRTLGGGDDGLFVSLVVAHLVARLGQSLAELIRPVGWPAVTPDLRVPFEGDPVEALERIAGQCGGQVSRLDGVRAEYEDGWGLARLSITEPLITMRFEGRDRHSLCEVARRFLRGSPELYDRIKERLHG